ncbi:NUDIX hydrolase [Mesorhizobium sp. NBSH29]|uniref:NUDIX hydrolase n=1 Tax=Mesorhizobium sp. NBSH29 TaxID=2654249 RepID=UPI00189694E7|nr:NUDIX hydrolase [Mesorhizobium sp. NBSH29]QPC85867.1 NUDIX hydrolase [Mesorhizobium sp. NBSH29]
MSALLTQKAGMSSAEPASDLQQYAALPWRIDRDGFLEVLLVTSRRRGRWTVPKGWQMKQRSGSQSAETEAFEEAGVVGRIDDKPIGSFRYSKRRDDGTFDPCFVTIFGLHVQGTLHSWPEKSQRKRRWMKIAQACEVAGEPTLAAFLGTLKPTSAECRS